MSQKTGFQPNSNFYPWGAILAFENIYKHVFFLFFFWGGNLGIKKGS